MSRMLGVMFVLASGLTVACAVDETNDGPDAAQGGAGGVGGTGGSGGTGGTGGTTGDCTPEDCGPPIPLPGDVCPDGSAPPAECARREHGICGWGVGECPPPAGECADLTRETIVLSGSLRYGECLEGCNATLTIAATSLNRAPPCDEVQLFVCDNDADGLCTEHGGTLTPVAHDLARRLAADLVGTALLPEYGCPDCADGGASTVELSRQGAHSSHRYETSHPPAELVAADAFVQGLIESLRSCASTENVDVFPGCVPRP